MSKLLKVDGHTGLARNKQTGAIVNINRSSIENARHAKLIRIKKAEENLATESRISKLEDKMDRILTILEGKTNG